MYLVAALAMRALMWSSRLSGSGTTNPGTGHSALFVNWNSVLTH